VRKLSLVFFLFCLSVWTETFSQENRPILKCEPSSFTLGDRIAITLPKPHPKGWAVKTPDGKWIYLQDSSKKSLTLSNQYEPGVFESKFEIKLNTKQLKGTIWKNGKAFVVHVFQKPGTYLLYFADNLETEPENTFFIRQKVNLIK
jgi:hypothetical protein